MTLSQKTQEILVVAMANRPAAAEISAAIAAASTAGPAASVAALAAYVAVTGLDGSGSNAASKADVDSQLGAVYTKINAILTALKNADLME